MSPVYDCTTESGRAEGIAAAVEVVRDGGVVVLPTDTVYGIGADAFSAEAVASVLAAKGRGREMPPPVLVPSVRTVDGLATDIPEWARDLIREFWPGPLTLVFKAQSSLMWDLGDTNGTVAVRMPQDDTALALLTEVGPMAVTSANLTGQPPATTVTDAAAQLGASVAVYLDGGPDDEQRGLDDRRLHRVRARGAARRGRHPAADRRRDAGRAACERGPAAAGRRATDESWEEPADEHRDQAGAEPAHQPAAEPAHHTTAEPTDTTGVEPTQAIELSADPTAERTPADHPGETR